LGKGGIKIIEVKNMAETTVNQTTKTKPNYKAMVEEGLRKVDRLLQKMELNQTETARLREESKEISQRIDEKFKEF
jgi:L-lysine 2,3-aminomutase